MKLDISNAARAEVLTQALPYIQKFYGKVVVIKYGGNAMINETLKEQVMEDIVLLHLVGVQVVLVQKVLPSLWFAQRNVVA
jgi:acetylglutamate kinase